MIVDFEYDPSADFVEVCERLGLPQAATDWDRLDVVLTEEMLDGREIRLYVEPDERTLQIYVGGYAENSSLHMTWTRETGWIIR